MNSYEEKLKQFMQQHAVQGEHLSFTESCHSVADAAKAVSAPLDAFVKNICMIDAQGRLIVAIVKGEDRASTARVGQALQIDPPRMATPEEILQRTGYPCGGTPSFGYAAIFLIDKLVMEKDTIYSGGDSVSSLVKISTKHLQEANQGMIVHIRK